jgi:hypothetical protein
MSELTSRQARLERRLNLGRQELRTEIHDFRDRLSKRRKTFRYVLKPDTGPPTMSCLRSYRKPVSRHRGKI